MPDPIITPNRISESDRTTESHERTYVQTEMSDRTAHDLALVDARRGDDTFTTIGDILEAGLWPTDRHPVVRTGERQPIPPHVRSAVWYRDRGRCELCPDRSLDGPWHLDHITPWSAGGSDRTTNLRVLCERHNMDRGNRIDPTERPRRAATWWCYRCYGLETESWMYAANGMPVGCPIHRYSDKACPVKRGYRRQIELAGEIPTWHRREYMDEAEATVIAFCAHCGIPSLTDQPL